MNKKEYKELLFKTLIASKDIIDRIKSENSIKISKDLTVLIKEEVRIKK